MKIAVSHDSIIPLHTQLLNQLRHLILSGQWPPGSRLPSETELQRELKVSRSTIRQALGNAEAEGLIERVPGKGTFVALSPVGRRNNFLGYITFDFFSDFQRQLLKGAESAAKAQGYRILFSNSNRDVSEEDRLLDQLLEDQVGGILIWPAIHDDPSRRLFQLVNQGTIPVVLMDRTLPGLACDYVTSDNHAGAYSAIQHLIELGHRRIVFLSRPILQLLPIAERLQGYQEALQDAGLAPLNPWLVGTPGREIGTRRVLNGSSDADNQEIKQIAEYLAAPQRPTAIFAMNDLMAMQALRAAELVGLRVPDDLSLVGFDDMEIAAHLKVPLTSVAQDTFTMGKRATELLIERIGGYSGAPRRETLPTQLRVRASTAPPPSP